MTVSACRCAMTCSTRWSSDFAVHQPGSDITLHRIRVLVSDALPKSLTLEFRTVYGASLLRTVAAMANSCGGVLLPTVADRARPARLAVRHCGYPVIAVGRLDVADRSGEAPEVRHGALDLVSGDLPVVAVRAVPYERPQLMPIVTGRLDLRHCANATATASRSLRVTEAARRRGEGSRRHVSCARLKGALIALYRCSCRSPPWLPCVLAQAQAVECARDRECQFRRRSTSVTMVNTPTMAR